MTALKKGQGAALAVVPEPLARTPERAALAKAIEDRDYVAVLVAERKALAQQIEEARYPLYREEEALEERRKRLPKDDRDRLAALLARDDPDAGDERKQVEAALADVKQKQSESWEAQRRAEADIRLLEEDHAARVRDVANAADCVIRADPCVPVVMAEFEMVAKRAAILRRACGSALNRTPPGGGYLPQALLAGKVFPPDEPCAWEQAATRLLNDPDAILPMPEDV